MSLCFYAFMFLYLYTSLSLYLYFYTSISLCSNLFIPIYIYVLLHLCYPYISIIHILYVPYHRSDCHTVVPMGKLSGICQTPISATKHNSAVTMENTATTLVSAQPQSSK